MKFYGKATKVGMLWGWFAGLVIEIMWLPTAMVTARLLTPEEFGIAAAASFFMQLAARLTQFGFNAALVRMNPMKDEHAETAFLMSVVLGCSAWLVLSLSAPLIAVFFKSPQTGQILPVSALSFLAIPFGTVPNALMLREL